MIDVTNGTCYSQQMFQVGSLNEASEWRHTDVDVRLVTSEGGGVVSDLVSAPRLLHGVHAPLVAESATRGAHESA